MKAGIVGIGAVGAATAMAIVLRASVRELVLVNRNRARARGVATDMRYGAPLSGSVRIAEGDYADLAGHERVFGSGTTLDSLRLRVHIAQRLGVSAQSVEAQVVGEHGTSSVFLWSSARVGGAGVREVVARRRIGFDQFRRAVEHDVRYANISIIEGIGASQYGIGMVAARFAEAVLRDERVVFPVGSYQPRYGVTLSLPAVLGRQGVAEVLWPDMAAEEAAGIERSAEALKCALASVHAR